MGSEMLGVGLFLGAVLLVYALAALSVIDLILEGRAIKKFIYKPGRIIGIVTAPA